MPEQIQTNNPENTLKIVIIIEFFFFLVLILGGIPAIKAIIKNITEKELLISNTVHLGWIFIGSGIFAISCIVSKMLIIPKKKL